MATLVSGTEQQMLDVVFFVDGGIIEKHFDIGFVAGGDRQIFQGVELGERINTVLLQATESVLMLEENVTIKHAPASDFPSYAQSKLAEMGECYHVHISDGLDVQAFCAYRVRMAGW